MSMKNCDSCGGIGKIYDPETQSTEICDAPGCKEGKVPGGPRTMEGPAPGGNGDTGQ